MASYFNILYKEDSTEGNVDLIEGNNDVGSSLDRTSDPVLPLELQDNIVNELHEDMETLKSCNLTCRAWCWTARSHLFKSVVLKDRRACLRFLCVLDESLQAGAGVGSFVQRLELPPPNKADYTRSPRANYRHRSKRLYLWRRITSHLPNVTRLRITQCDLSGFLRDLRSDILEFPNVQDAISSIYNLPCLRTIDFDHTRVGSANELLQFLGTFPHLAAARLHGFYNLRIPDSESFDIASILDFMERHQQETIRLEELMVHNGFHIGHQFPELLSVLSESPFEMRLKRLWWTTLSRGRTPTDWEALCPHVERIFGGSQSTLEYLHLGVDADDAWLERFNLSACDNLKELHLTFRFAYEDLNEWPNVPSFLSSATSTNLRAISIAFNVFKPRLPFSPEFFDWRRLNDALLSVYKRCPLVSFSITFTFIQREPAEVHDPVRTRLAPILESGMQVDIVSRFIGAVQNSFPS